MATYWQQITSFFLAVGYKKLKVSKHYLIPKHGVGFLESFSD